MTSKIHTTAILLAGIAFGLFLAINCGVDNANGDDEQIAVILDRLDDIETRLGIVETDLTSLQTTFNSFELELDGDFVKDAPADAGTTAVAQCPSGQTVVGGGCWCETPGSSIEWSRPYFQSECAEQNCLFGWECSCAGGRQIAYAICSGVLFAD
jgi:hypothetical protein